MIDVKTIGPDGYSRSNHPRPLTITTRLGIMMTLVLEGPERGNYQSPSQGSRKGYFLPWPAVYMKLNQADQDLYFTTSRMPDEPAPE